MLNYPSATYGNALLLQNRGSSRNRLDTEKLSLHAPAPPQCTLPKETYPTDHDETRATQTNARYTHHIHPAHNQPCQNMLMLPEHTPSCPPACQQGQVLPKEGAASGPHCNVCLQACSLQQRFYTRTNTA